MAGAHQRQRRLQLLVAGVQHAPQRREFAAGHQFQVIERQQPRGRQAGRGRVEQVELQRQAFAHAARADPGWVEALHDRQYCSHVFAAGIDLGTERGGDLLERIAEVTVVIDGIDDGAADGLFAGRELRQLELPKQVFTQRLAGGVGDVLLPLVVARAPGIFGRTDALVVPGVVDDLDVDGGLGRGRLAAHLGGGQRLEGGGFGLLVLLEHDVAFERLADVRLQFDGRQLQQAYGLLQLRCHRQRLAQAELQGGFEQ